MRIFFLILMTTVFLACNSQKEVKTSNDPVLSNNVKLAPDCSIALKFINEYTGFTSSKTAATDTNWIEHNSLLTRNFKTAYKNLLDSAKKADPEMGLDFDPVLDAQDFPYKGFELMNCDSSLGYITVRGKDWKEFVLVLKLALQDNTWLVDGSGVINIPFDKRAKR